LTNVPFNPTYDPLSYFDILYQNGKTPLDWACEGNHADAMQYLVELGAKYDEKDNVSCHTHPCVVYVCVTSVSSLPVPCICFYTYYFLVNIFRVGSSHDVNS
jgi:hypothetical protein